MIFFSRHTSQNFCSSSVFAEFGYGHGVSRIVIRFRHSLAYLSGTIPASGYSKTNRSWFEATNNSPASLIVCADSVVYTKLECADWLRTGHAYSPVGNPSKPLLTSYMCYVSFSVWLQQDFVGLKLTCSSFKTWSIILVSQVSSNRSNNLKV